MTRSLRLMTLPLVLVFAACGSSADPKGGSGGSSGSGGNSGSGGSCGSTCPVEQMIPASGSITGWTVDPSSQYTTNTACTLSRPASGAVDCIDGSADPFVQKGATAFAGQQYLNGTKYITLHLVEFASAADAQTFYTYLEGCPVDVCHSLYDQTWEALTSLGDASKIANTGTTWFLVGRSGKFFFELKFGHKPVEEATDAEKPEAIAFATAVASKLAGN